MADLTLDLSEVFSSLDRLDRRLAEVEKSYTGINTAAARSAQAQRTAFAGANDAVLREVAAINRLQKEYDETAQAVQTLRRALAGAYDQRAVQGYTKAIADAEAGMRKMERAASAAGVNLKKASGEASTGRQVFENFFGTLTKATIIIAVLDQVRKLVTTGLELADNYSKAQKSFTAFLGSADRADQVLASLNRTAKENFLPVQDVQEAGKALLAFGESADNLPAVLTRIADISAATGKDFNELTLIYGKARTAGVLYAEDLNQLTEAGIPIVEQFAKQLGVSASEVKKLASEGKIGFSELELAFAQLTREGSAFAGQAKAGATETGKLSTAFDEFAATIGTIIKPAVDDLKASLTGILTGLTDLAKSTTFDEFGNNFIQLFERVNPIAGKLGQLLRNALGVKTAGESGQDLEADIRQQNQLARQAFEDQEEIFLNAEKKRKELNDKSAKERAKARQAELKAREEYNKRRAELALENLAPGSEERAIAEENLRFERLKAEFQKYNLETESIEAQHVKNLLDIRAEFYRKRLSIQQAGEKLGRDVAEQFVQQREAAAERQRDAGLASIEIFDEQAKRFIIQLKAAGESEKVIRYQQEQFDLLSKRARLQNELEFQEGLLKITNAGDTARLEQIKQAIALLKEQIQTVSVQLTASEPGAAGSKFSIWKAFGIDPDSDEGARAIESLKSSADVFKSVIADVAAARKAAADAAVEQANRQVEAAENALDREIELSQAGFAANVELRQQQLNEAKEQQRQALEEQRAAARAQLAIDGAQQASNIALSATNLYKTWSTLPFGVGLIAAAAQVASLIALIASVRARARALSAPQQFRQGGEIAVKNGVLVGPSHEGGGIPIEAEGGEFTTTDGKRLSIVNKKMTDRHFDLLQAINKDDRRAIARHALALSPEIEIDRKKVNARLFGDSQSGGTAYDPDISRKLDQLIQVQQRQLQYMIEESRRPRPLDEKTIQQGNRTTRFIK